MPSSDPDDPDAGSSDFDLDQDDDLFAFLREMNGEDEWPAFQQETSDIPLPQVREGAMLSAAQERLVARLRAGAVSPCECCGQKVGIYKRSITSTMARWLMRLVHRYEQTQGWVHLDDLKKMEGGGDYAKLQSWGLLEHRVNTDTNKTQSGYWKPTTQAIEFAHGRLALPMPAWMYNGQVLGYEPKLKTIEECLGKKFSMLDVWSGIRGG